MMPFVSGFVYSAWSFAIHHCCVYQLFVPFCCWLVYHFRDMPQFVSPFANWCSFGLFSGLAIMNKVIEKIQAEAWQALTHVLSATWQLPGIGQGRSKMPLFSAFRPILMPTLDAFQCSHRRGAVSLCSLQCSVMWSGSGPTTGDPASRKVYSGTVLLRASGIAWHYPPSV